MDALAGLASGRALVQVSFRSLAGTFGRTIKKTAWRLVEEEIADLVATDCTPENFAKWSRGAKRAQKAPPPISAGAFTV